jgi:DNA-binding PadR family transcriptional regulator
MCGSFGWRGSRAEASGWRGYGRGFDPNFLAWFWGGPPGQGRHRRHFRGGRMFDQGDLKYVILQLLADKPRHGYEIIKELEERSGGAYSPSPGTVYPTLTMLEEMGYATATQEEGSGKRIYEITQAGRDYLGENRSTVDDIFERIAEFGASFFSGAMMEVNHAFKDLGRATYTTAPHYARDADRLRRIVEVLQRAAREIEEIGK